MNEIYEALGLIGKFFMLFPPYVFRVKELSQDEVVEIGHITHFFSKISVAIVELTATLNVGDRILVKGPATDFEQVVDSMQIEHENVKSAEAGQSIGLKTAQPVKERDVVYRKL